MCLGNFGNSSPAFQQWVDYILKVILAYLLIGSYGLLFCHWRQGRAAGKLALQVAG